MALITVLVMVVLAASPALSAQLGEPCRDDHDCAHDQHECIKRFEDCEKKGCFCKPDYGGRFTGACKRMLGASDRCYHRVSSHVGCPPGTQCDSISDKCVAELDVGSACIYDRYNTYLDIHCTTGADCVNSLCECGSYYKKVGGKCIKNPFGEACVVDSCESNYKCLGTSPTCKCLNSTYTKQTYNEEGSDKSACIHADAKTDVALGGACRYGDTENTGKICKSGLTCSICLIEDPPTCIKPGGGADGVKAGFFILSAALLLTKLI